MIEKVIGKLWESDGKIGGKGDGKVIGKLLESDGKLIGKVMGQ